MQNAPPVQHKGVPPLRKAILLQVSACRPNSLYACSQMAFLPEPTHKFPSTASAFGSLPFKAFLHNSLGPVLRASPTARGKSLPLRAPNTKKSDGKGVARGILSAMGLGNIRGNSVNVDIATGKGAPKNWGTAKMAPQRNTNLPQP